MAVYTGSDGVVKIGTASVAEVKSWTLEATGDTVESSAMGQGAWKNYLATLKSWSGSIECQWDDDDATGQGALILGATVALKLYPTGDDDGNVMFSGNAIVTGVSRSVSNADIITASFTYQGTGALTESTVA